VWEFIRDLLKEREYCPSLIRWEDHEEGTFRIVNCKKVAKLWGDKKKNNKMNYEKLSRAMR
jgi:Ets-domain